MTTDTTILSQRYALDCQHMQTIVRAMMTADPWFAERWEPPYGGMITALMSANAYPLEVSWIQDSGGTTLTATLLAPQHSRLSFLGLGKRAAHTQQVALHSFFAKVDRAVERRVASDRIASAL